jgi:hypothetical protein
MPCLQSQCCLEDCNDLPRVQNLEISLRVYTRLNHSPARADTDLVCTGLSGFSVVVVGFAMMREIQGLKNALKPAF